MSGLLTLGLLSLVAHEIRKHMDDARAKVSTGFFFFNESGPWRGGCYLSQKVQKGGQEAGLMQKAFPDQMALVLGKTAETDEEMQGGGKRAGLKWQE